METYWVNEHGLRPSEKVVAYWVNEQGQRPSEKAVDRLVDNVHSVKYYSKSLRFLDTNDNETQDASASGVIGIVEE